MSDVNVSQYRARKRINNIFIFSFIAWTATIAGLFFIYYHNEYNMSLSSARSAAVHSLRKDLLYRKWASVHGGVYVPVTESTQPNPYLSSVPERDVETTTGKKLTLISSGCMNDEIFKLGLEEYGIYGHNTSLNPVNTKNSPDDWERKALLNLQNGGTEYFGLDKIGGSEHLRYMLPMTIRDECLSCHNHQGYKVGDLGGGTVVSVPWDEFQSGFIEELKTVGGIHAIVWFLGLTGMFGARRMITSQISEQETALDALAKSERILNTVLQATSVGIGLIKDRVIQWTNDAMLEQTGYSPKELFGQPSRQFYVNDQEYELSGALMYADIAAKRKSTIETRFRKKDGTFIEVLMNLSAVDKADLSQGAVVVLMDVTESKKMAHELQENIMRMERAEAAAKFGNWEIDLNTRRMRASKGAFNIYGLQQDEIDLETIQKIPLPEYREKLDEALSSLIQKQKPYDIEFKAVRQLDGKIIDIHSTAEFNPETNTIWGVIQDITTQREAQEALIRSEAKYRMLTENVKDIIWSTDRTTKFTYISPSVMGILGYQPEEMLQKTYFELLPPNIREQFESIYNASINASKYDAPISSKTYEVEIIKKDGSRIWVEIVSNPSIDSRGNLLGFQGVTRDISQRKRAEEALRESESKFRSYVESSPIGIYETDSEGIVYSTNNALTSISGYANDELLKRNIMELVAPQHVGKCLQAFETLKHLGKASVEAEVISSGGSTDWIDINAVKLSDNRYLLFAQDITDRKKVEATLRENEERLSLALEVSNAGCWEWFIETDEVLFDERFHAMLGYEMGELPTSIEDWLPYHHQGDMTAWMSKAEECMRGDRATFESEHRLQSKTGEWKWVFSRGKMVSVDSTKSQKRFIGMAMDITELKTAQEALSEREVIYRILFEGARDGIIIVDMEGDSTGRIVSANPEAAKMHGYTLEEFTTLMLGDIEKADSQKDLQSRIDTILSGQLLRIELNHCRKDGSEFPVEVSANLVEILGHKYCIGFDRDISERKLAEEALRESEAKFRSYVESSPIGIFESDSEGRMVSANPANTLITGYTHDELMQMNIMDAVAPSHRDKCSKAFESLKATDQVAVEIEATTSIGDIIWEYVTGVKLSDNRYLFFSQDITERKKTETELEAKSNETLQLMKSMINGFVLFESVFDEYGEFVDCRYVFTNDAFDRILGLSGKELIGKTIYEVWPDTEKAWIENFKDVALSGIGKCFEMYHAPMKKYYYCTVYRPTESPDKTCLIFEDVTERKQAQEELLEMERKLLQSQKLESLGVLAGGIAHDFNNLLAVIIGNIELAQEIDFDSAEKALFLERAMSASMKSARLIRQMLDYSGKGAFELNDVNLSELVDNNIDIFRMTVPKNINLKVDSPQDDIFVKGDLNQIQQVMMNLLINASEAVDGKTGTIEIATGAQYCDESLISRSLLPEKPEPQDMAFIRVSDDGGGMDIDTVKRIFEPFFSTKFTGRGLGMSVVHGVVRGHHGAVTIDSQPGVGTTVTVYLPLLYRTGHAEGAQDSEESCTALTEEKSPEKKKFFVLVVDDEQEVLDLVLRQLRVLGCQTLSAMNGKEALEVFNRNPEIDLVILDLVMPEMGGVEAFNRLKELKPDLMTVICSGYNEEQVKDEFKSEFKPTAFVTKPYRLAALKDLVELLRGKSPVN